MRKLCGHQEGPRSLSPEERQLQSCLPMVGRGRAVSWGWAGRARVERSTGGDPSGTKQQSPVDLPCLLEFICWSINIECSPALAGSVNLQEFLQINLSLRLVRI